MFSIQSTFASNGFQSSLERKNMAFSYWESTEWLEGNDLIVIGGGIVGLSAALQASAAIWVAGESPITATLYTTTYASACLLESPQAQYLWLTIHREFRRRAGSYRLYGHFCDLQLGLQ